MRTTLATAMAGLCAMLTVGCASVDSRGEKAESFSAQALKGGTLYESNCANCHGVLGAGTHKGPRVVGLKDGALPLQPRAEAKKRLTQFRTMGDVARFVIKNMPGDEPGSLKEEDYFRILAFDLRANGIDLDQHLDMALADTIVIPREQPEALSQRDTSPH
jgi:S-disulfanyl-L-cysteine oxidoreductase SoxD